MEDIHLSVILTTHLRPVLLERAIKSIASLGNNVQIVLCSDEGTKATRQTAADCLREHDAFCAVPGLRGPAETRNLGMTLATGNYISFLDDDDTLDPNLISLLPLFDGTQVFYTNYRKIFEADQGTEREELRRVEKKTSKRDISSLMVKNFLHVGCFFAPRELARHLAFRSDLTSSEDWEFLLQLYKSAPFRHVDILGSNWHISEGEASRDKVGRKVRARNCRAIYKHHPASDEALRLQRINRLRELGENDFDDVS